GYVTVWLNHPHTNVAVWLPTLMLLSERLLEARSWARQVGLAALLASVVGVQFTGGHVETSVDVLFFLAVFHLLRGSQTVLQERLPPGHKLRLLIALPGVAVVLGT